MPLNQTSIDRARQLGINLNKPALTLSEAKAVLGNNKLSASDAAAQLGVPVANMQTGKIRQPDGAVSDIPGNKSSKGITVSQARYVTGNENLSARDAARTLGTNVVNAQTGYVAKYDSGKAASEQRKAVEGLTNLFNDEYDVIRTEGKKSGLSSMQINALLSNERESNRAELDRVKAAQDIAGVQTFGLLDGSFRSGMAFSQTLPSATRVMNAGYDYLNKNNIPFSHNDGKTIVGFETYASPGVRGSGVLDAGYASLNQQNGRASVNSDLSRGNESPRTAQNFVRYFNAINNESANPTLSKNAKVIDSGVDPQGNRYQILSDTIAEGIKGGTTGVFVRKADGSVSMLSASPQITPTGGSFWEKWGGLILGVASGFALGPLAGFLGGGSATLGSTIAAGGLLGAGSSALTGGNILTGALLGAAGGYASGVIGQAGGLGNFLKTSGLEISDDLARTLNSFVSGTSIASPDDIAAARNAVNASAAAGAIDDAAAATITSSIDDVARVSDDLVRGGTLNQINPNVQTSVSGSGFTALNPPTTFGGYGLTSSNPAIANAVAQAFRDVAFANADEVTQAAINAARAAGQNISLTMPGGQFVLTATPAGLVTQTPFNQFGQTGPVFGAGQTPGAAGAAAGAAGAGSLLDDAANFIRNNPGLTAGIIAGAVGGTQQPEQEEFEMPAWVTDPSQSAVQGRVAMANQAFNAAQQPLPNLFDAQFQRGGLGAGQYFGYDLLNRTGNIPQETLLGIPTLATAPINLLGANGGQATPSQAALV